jgi:hypothetical protein
MEGKGEKGRGKEGERMKRGVGVEKGKGEAKGRSIGGGSEEVRREDVKKGGKLTIEK